MDIDNLFVGGLLALGLIGLAGLALWGLRETRLALSWLTQPVRVPARELLQAQRDLQSRWPAR
jgi:hypothetical protein